LNGTGEQRRALAYRAVKAIENSMRLFDDRGGNDKAAVRGLDLVRRKRRSLRLSWGEALHPIAGAELCRDNRGSRTQMKA
jgi:hypothetical protein